METEDSKAYLMDTCIFVSAVCIFNMIQMLQIFMLINGWSWIHKFNSGKTWEVFM